MGSLTPYLVVIIFFIFKDAVSIKYEEKKLEDAISEAWLAYKKNLRRWI